MWCSIIIGVGSDYMAKRCIPSILIAEMKDMYVLIFSFTQNALSLFVAREAL